MHTIVLVHIHMKQFPHVHLPQYDQSITNVGWIRIYKDAYKDKLIGTYAYDNNCVELHLHELPNNHCQ